MDYNELVQCLKEQLQHYGPKVPYGKLVGAEPPYNQAGDLVWPDPEPYYIKQAINAITELLARVEEAETDNKRLCGVMMQLKRTERPERLSVVYELEYNSSLAHNTVEDVAGIIFKGLMDDFSKPINKEEQQ